MTTNPAPDIELTNRADVPAGWYVEIDRQYTPASLAVGPYRTEEVADSAMADSLLIDDLCQTDCLDAAIRAAADLDPVVELLIVDPDDDDHHGPIRCPQIRPRRRQS